MAEGEKETKKKVAPKDVLISLAVLLAVLAYCGKSSKKAEAPAPTGPIPAFAADRTAACKQYRDAPNEIKKSEIYSTFAGTRYAANDIVGVVTEISTPKGGDRVQFEVESSVGKFTSSDSNPFGEYSIEKGTPLYAQIGGLAVGARVKFSATGLKPYVPGQPEEFVVCYSPWVAKFTKIERL